jgi:hypothetical protein
MSDQLRKIAAFKTMVSLGYAWSEKYWIWENFKANPTIAVTFGDRYNSSEQWLMKRGYKWKGGSLWEPPVRTVIPTPPQVRIVSDRSNGLVRWFKHLTH